MAAEFNQIQLALFPSEVFKSKSIHKLSIFVGSKETPVGELDNYQFDDEIRFDGGPFHTVMIDNVSAKEKNRSIVIKLKLTEESEEVQIANIPDYNNISSEEASHDDMGNIFALNNDENGIRSISMTLEYTGEEPLEDVDEDHNSDENNGDDNNGDEHHEEAHEDNSDGTPNDPKTDPVVPSEPAPGAPSDSTPTPVVPGTPGAPADPKDAKPAPEETSENRKDNEGSTNDSSTPSDPTPTPSDPATNGATSGAPSNLEPAPAPKRKITLKLIPDSFTFEDVYIKPIEGDYTYDSTEWLVVGNEGEPYKFSYTLKDREQFVKPSEIIEGVFTEDKRIPVHLEWKDTELTFNVSEELKKPLEYVNFKLTRTPIMFKGVSEADIQQTTIKIGEKIKHKYIGDNILITFRRFGFDPVTIETIAKPEPYEILFDGTLNPKLNNGLTKFGVSTFELNLPELREYNFKQVNVISTTPGGVVNTHSWYTSKKAFEIQTGSTVRFEINDPLIVGGSFVSQDYRVDESGLVITFTQDELPLKYIPIPTWDLTIPAVELWVPKSIEGISYINAWITVNGKPVDIEGNSVTLQIEKGTEVVVEFTNPYYTPYVKQFTIEGDTALSLAEIRENLKLIRFNVNVSLSPETAKLELLGTKINGKSVFQNGDVLECEPGAEYSMIITAGNDYEGKTLKFFASHDGKQIEETLKPIVREQKDSVIYSPTSLRATLSEQEKEEFFDKVYDLMAKRHMYKHLQIHRYLNLYGVNDKGCELFFKQFAKYCVHRLDFKIYNMLREYYVGTEK